MIQAFSSTDGINSPMISRNDALHIQLRLEDVLDSLPFFWHVREEGKAGEGIQELLHEIIWKDRVYISLRDKPQGCGAQRPKKTDFLFRYGGFGALWVNSR